MAESAAIMLNVYDSLEAASSASSSVKVRPSGSTSSVVADLLAMDSVEELKDISLVSYALNANDCSISPDCPLLNRLACHDKLHTCGACTGSYVGEEGSSNSTCIYSMLF